MKRNKFIPFLSKVEKEITDRLYNNINYFSKFTISELVIKINNNFF